MSEPTTEHLTAKLQRLLERLENLDDLMELRAAVEKNGGKPGIAWEQVKSELLGD